MLAEQLESYCPETVSSTSWTNLSSIYPFKELEQFLQKQAEAILESNYQELMSGNFDNIPLPVDVLSGAKESDEDSSLNSNLVSEALYNNSARLIAETMRRKSWEYYPPVHETYDPASEDLRVAGHSMNEHLQNGISPLAHPEEQAIRMQEYVDHHINLSILRDYPDQEVTLITIKECPDYILESYRQTPSKKHQYGGYVPEIEKIVIERTVLRNGVAKVDHVALPGTYIGHDLIVNYLQAKQCLDLNTYPSKLELRSMRFMREGKPIDLFDMVAELDQLATQKVQKEIFIGELLVDAAIKDYDRIEQIARDRQSSYHQLTSQVSSYILDLYQKGTDKRLAETKLSNYLKKLLYQVASKEPELAEVIFDAQTAHLIQTAHILAESGFKEESSKLLEVAYDQAPSTDYCGAGSCDLVAVPKNSKEEKEARKNGLNGELVKDTVRTCPKCKTKRKTVVYDLKTAAKFCTNCGAKEN